MMLFTKSNHHPTFTNRPAAVIKSSAARFSASLVFHFSEEAASEEAA